jgi:hypothetical protein
MKTLVTKSLLPKYIKVLALILVLFSPVTLMADDPGISKVRIIQTGEKTYIFETDITEALLWTLKVPIFPDRFELSKPKSMNQSGWITIRIEIRTNGDPLSVKDEIILPWTRNAVDITVQWLNGDSYKGLYQRKFKGIHIPIKELMPVTKTSKELFTENFNQGLQHFPFAGIHLLLILSLVLFIPNKKVFRVLLYMSFGQMLAMLTISFNLTFANIIFSDLLFVLLILLISYCLAYGKQFKQLGTALLLAGFIHSTGYANESTLLQDLPSAQKSQALFAFNVAMDLGHYALTLLLLGVLKLASLQFQNKRWPSIVIGALSVFLMLFIGSEYILTGETQLIKTNENASITYNASSGGSQQNAAQRGSATMTTPIMVFLSVEPYELRQEILVVGRAANELLQFNKDNSQNISIDKQESIKEELLRLIVENDSMLINNKKIKAIETNVNFVTLGMGGVSIRETAISENIEDALIGISLLYEFEGFPDSIQSKWKVFPHDVNTIEYQAVDPHSNTSSYLTPQNNIFKWKSKLKNYKEKTIEPIEAKRTARPVISYLLWLILVVMFVLTKTKQKKDYFKPVFVMLMVVSFICYPFVWVTVNLPFIPVGKPSAEKSELVLNDLLSNVYRAFDRRNEDAVYDRLAMSVTEQQLSDIYLQNRQAMALENRGGARANVDEVNVKTVHDVERSANNSYMADTEWTVRGSVNHFGHTHYRQNQYRALVSFLIEEGVWKINEIEILDTQRLY